MKLPKYPDTTEEVLDQNEQLRVENARLDTELTALKTPHCCMDCAWFDEDLTPLCQCLETGCDVTARSFGWLCGHFKAKGTQ